MCANIFRWVTRDWAGGGKPRPSQTSGQCGMALLAAGALPSITFLGALVTLSVPGLAEVDYCINPDTFSTCSGASNTSPPSHCTVWKKLDTRLGFRVHKQFFSLWHFQTKYWRDLFYENKKMQKLKYFFLITWFFSLCFVTNYLQTRTYFKYVLQANAKQSQMKFSNIKDLAKLSKVKTMTYCWSWESP